jgi:hypothetical protein
MSIHRNFRVLILKVRTWRRHDYRGRGLKVHTYIRQSFKARTCHGPISWGRISRKPIFGAAWLAGARLDAAEIAGATFEASRSFGVTVSRAHLDDKTNLRCSNFSAELPREAAPKILPLPEGRDTPLVVNPPPVEELISEAEKFVRGDARKKLTVARLGSLKSDTIDSTREMVENGAKCPSEEERKRVLTNILTKAACRGNSENRTSDYYVGAPYVAEAFVGIRRVPEEFLGFSGIFRGDKPLDVEIRSLGSGGKDAATKLLDLRVCPGAANLSPTALGVLREF